MIWLLRYLMTCGGTLATGAHKYRAYRPLQFAQNRLHGPKHCIFWRRKLGNNTALINLMIIYLVVEIFDDLCIDFGLWAAFGAHIYKAQWAPHLAQNRLNKHEIHMVHRYRLGNNSAVFRLMIIVVVVEIFNGLWSNFGWWSAHLLDLPTYTTHPKCA